MGEKTGIAWCDHTFNPWWGCSRVSAGCDNCYAHFMGRIFGKKCFGENPRHITGKKNWLTPLAWDRWAEEAEERRLVFCGSMMDWAEDNEQLIQHRTALWQMIHETQNLTWLLLTKRADRIAECLPDDWGDGYKNVWLGVTAENQEMANQRIPLLLQVPTVCRFVSFEPLLGPVDLTRIRVILSQGGICCGSVLGDTSGRLFSPRMSDGNGIHWAIVGGESGPGYRPMDLDWARKLRDDCRETAVPFFFKQSGGVKPGVDVELDGELIQEFPIIKTETKK